MKILIVGASGTLGSHITKTFETDHEIVAISRKNSSTSEDDFYKGVKSKMMGQINLVLIGQHYIRNGGSFTLTTGILSDDPIRNGANLTTINAAVNGFVLAASGELVKKGVRINAVSPGLLEDSAEVLGAYFPGHTPVSADKVMDAYRKSVLGMGTGQVIKVY